MARLTRRHCFGLVQQMLCKLFGGIAGSHGRACGGDSSGSSRGIRQKVVSVGRIIVVHREISARGVLLPAQRSVGIEEKAARGVFASGKREIVGICHGVEYVALDIASVSIYAHILRLLESPFAQLVGSNPVYAGIGDFDFYPMAG